MLAVTADVFGLSAEDEKQEEPDETAGVLIPASFAVLGLAFAATALVIAGLPPLAGFVAKFSLMAAILRPDPVPGSGWVVLGLVVLSGLASVIALARAGVRAFWAGASVVPRVRLIEIVPVTVLVGAALALTFLAGPTMRFIHGAAGALEHSGEYAREVLKQP
jgi:multicomponent K+:H+ antiporter subunit D